MKTDDFDIFGRITKRYTTLNPNGSADPLATRYDIIPSPNTDPRMALKLPNHLPARRISRGARIIPAEEGDPCVISKRSGVIIVWAFTEGVPFKEACP